jgi:hypothetical protein
MNRFYVCFGDDTDGIIQDYIVIAASSYDAGKMAAERFTANFHDAVIINITDIPIFKTPIFFSKAYEQANLTFGPNAFSVATV